MCQYDQYHKEFPHPYSEAYDKVPEEPEQNLRV